VEGPLTESGFKAWQATLQEALTEVTLADWVAFKVLHCRPQTAGEDTGKRKLDVKKTCEAYGKRLKGFPKDHFAALQGVWISSVHVSTDSSDASCKTEAASLAFCVYKAALFHGVHPAGILSENTAWADDADEGPLYSVKGSPFDVIAADHQFL
jgi:hypothetical protein